MTIPINPPITEPAVAKKVFDQWFFPNFAATNLHDPANARLTFDQVPQNAESKEFQWAGKITTSGNFWDIVQNVPGAGQVMQDVLDILPAIKTYLDSK